MNIEKLAKHLKEFTIDVNNAMEQVFKRKSIFKKLKLRRKK